MAGCSELEIKKIPFVVSFTLMRVHSCEMSVSNDE